MKPTVALCVPTFNRADRLASMLPALLDALTRHPQRQRFTVLVSDNCSTDATPEVIARSLAQSSAKFTALRQDRNLGFAGNFAALLASADGDAFIILADDDRLRPESLDCLLKMADRISDNLPLAINNTLPGGDRVRRGIPSLETEREIDGLAELLRLLGIFQISFVSNLMFRTSTARGEWRPEYTRTRYPHSLLALRLLARRPAIYSPARIVDVELPRDTGDQPLLTSIDMARLMTEYALMDPACRSLRGRVYGFLVRMLPTAVYQHRRGRWRADATNPFASLRGVNVAACYRRSRCWQAIALALWAAAWVIPVPLLASVLRRVSRHPR